MQLKQYLKIFKSTQWRIVGGNTYKYVDANNILFKESSELLQFYDDFYEDLRYQFYETEFGEFIMRMVYAKNYSVLSKIFDFTERLFIHGAEKMKTLAGVGIVENMYYERDFMNEYEELSKYFGPLTKQSFENWIN